MSLSVSKTIEIFPIPFGFCQYFSYFSSLNVFVIFNSVMYITYFFFYMTYNDSENIKKEFCCDARHKNN